MKFIRMYSIKDNKTGQYDTPFFCFNDVMAERRFIMSIREKQSIFHHFSTDFELVYLGTFDVTTGKLQGDMNLTILTGKQIDTDN